MRIHKQARLFAISVIMCVSWALPGCLIFGIEDEFSHRSGEESGEFVPSTYIRKNTNIIPLLIVRVDIDQLPHGMVLYLSDPTYLSTHEPFESFSFESFVIEYHDGEEVDVLQHHPKLYAISKERHGKTIVFEKVIKRRADFTLKLRGRAKKKTGEEVPFHSIEKYEYKKNGTFHTLLDEWASV